MKPIFKWLIGLWVLIIAINIIQTINRTIWIILVIIFIGYALFMMIKLRKMSYDFLKDKDEEDFIKKV